MVKQTSQQANAHPSKAAGFATAARVVMYGAVLYIVLAWAAFILIDAQNLWGLRDAMINSRMANPSIWYHLFRWNGFTEILQWLALAGGTLTAAYIAGQMRVHKYMGPAIFWGLMAITQMLILVEDAGDPRHTIALYMRSVFPNVPALVVSTVVELIYFALLGGIPLYALLRHGRYTWSLPVSRKYLLAGFLLYGSVAFSSGTRYIYDWFGQTGHKLHVLVTGGRVDLVKPLGWDLYLTNFYLMDNLVIESIEVIGASALFCAALTFLQQVEARPQQFGDIADGRLLPWGRKT